MVVVAVIVTEDGASSGFCILFAQSARFLFQSGVIPHYQRRTVVVEVARARIAPAKVVSFLPESSVRHQDC
jgi:hypothetical protein